MVDKKTEKFKIGNLEAGERILLGRFDGIPISMDIQPKLNCFILRCYIIRDRGETNNQMVYAESELGFKTDTGALLTIEYYSERRSKCKRTK